MTPLELIQALQWRYATKRFNPELSLPKETWEALEKALVLTPSSLGLQLWQFIHVTNPVTRQKLVEVSWGQPQITDASDLIVFAVRRQYTHEDKEKHLANLCALRHISRDMMNDYSNRIDALIDVRTPEQQEAWMSEQVYIALGNLITCAAVLGVDACPIEGLDPKSYDRILDLESTPYKTLCVLALGYRKDDPYANEVKVRYPKECMIIEK